MANPHRALDVALRPMFARASCGGLRLSLEGVQVVLRASGALWMARTRTLVVADLHLEKGSAYGVRGQLLPPFDSRETLRRLDAEVAALDPQVVVLLGDSFHDPAAEARLDPDASDRLTRLAGERALAWVVGNHDAEGPSRLPGQVMAQLEADGLNLTHEPAPGTFPGEVAGHLHPCAKLVRYGRGVRRRAFLTDGRRMILPAFGAYAGGLNVLDPAYEGLFQTPPTAAALGQDRVHALALTTLSTD